MKFAEEEKNRVSFFFFAKQQVIKVKIKGTIEDLNFFFLKIKKKERKKE